MSSDLSFAGSIESDLNISKVWLCQHLPKKKYNHVYILGSWYGNMGIIMRYMGIDFDHITNIDINLDFCNDTKKLYELAKFDRPYIIVNKDCNSIDYYNADLVINTSTNDIESHDWFANIPPKCMVAIQCRNNQPIVKNIDKPVTFKEFLSMFNMNSTICVGTMRLQNKEELYDRYMLIGKK